MNIVPKDGGNRFSGTFFSAWTDKKLAGRQPHRRHRRRAACAPAPASTASTTSTWPSAGPIKRDKLWFFTSGRMWSVNAPVADTFSCRRRAPATAAASPAASSGALSVRDRASTTRSIESALLRLTWQVTPKHKFSVYYDEIDKSRGHGMNAGDDPDTSSQIWTSPRYNSAAAKYTGTLSNQLLAEAGYSFNYEEYVITNQDGVNKAAFSPEWFAGASRRDQNFVDADQRPGQLGRPLSGSLQHDGRALATSPARTTSRPASSTTGART